MNFLKEIFLKKNIEKPANKDFELGTLALFKLKELENKEFSDRTFNEFVFIFRTFREEFSGIKKHLTHEEFVKRLKSQNLKKPATPKIIELSEKISKLEFSDATINEKKLKDLIIDFIKIINSI